jgi:hypothetical protein
MKKNLLLSALIALFGFSVNAQSDNQNGNPELTITKAGERLEATIACLDAIEAPTKYNAFANPFINTPGFPQKSATMSSQQLRSKIDQWFKDNPKVVNQVRAARKKSSDILYGPRPE